MNFRKRIFTAAVIMISLLLLYRLAAALLTVGNGRKAEVTAQSVVLQAADSSSEVDWLAAFSEISEEELYAREQSCGGIASVAVNQADGRLYFVFGDRSKASVSGVSESFAGWLTVQDVEVRSFSVRPKKTATSAVMAHPVLACLFIVAVLFGGAGIDHLVNYRFRRKKVKASAGPGGSNYSREEIPRVRFSDVEGLEELKSDVMRIVDSLRNPEKYEKMGARPTHGLILYGPPGTGKTLLAKAIAGEARVPFISAAGSDFVNKYVGVGAENVRNLFKKARKDAPCIIFIDEIDAVAGKRGSDYNSEREQTVNALLSELDGFTGRDGIVVICATNRLDMLDEAFTRSGRFDLKLAVGLPDRKARFRILQIHGKNKKFDESVDFESLSARTAGFSGADLQALLNESALLAAGKGLPAISSEEIGESFRKIVLHGNKVKILDEETRRLIAWHESGHTLATKLLTDDSVSTVTIIGSTSGAGGVTFRAPNENNIMKNRRYLLNLIRVMYAGRAAEEIYFETKGISGEEIRDLITIGASEDIRQATALLLENLAVYGLGESGPLDMTQFGKGLESLREEAKAEAKKLYADTLEFLRGRRDKLQRLAEVLFEKETLEEGEIDRILAA